MVGCLRPCGGGDSPGPGLMYSPARCPLPPGGSLWRIRIAGIDVHKKKLAVVVADVEVDDEYQFERRWYGSNPEHLRLLSEWLVEQQVAEVVMESTAQYWKPLWSALERYWKPSCENREGAGKMSGTLHLAQALSNRGRRGRKKDFRDAAADRQSAPRTSGRGPTIGGSPRFRGGFGATDHCRSGCQGSHVCLRQESRLVGRSMPGRSRERRREQ